MRLRLCAVGIASLELAAARELADALPTTEAFEAHADIALAIGMRGRRMEQLLGCWPLLGRKISAAIGPGAVTGINARAKVSACDLYRAVADEVATYGMAAYDLIHALDACIALSQPGQHELAQLQDGPLLPQLVELGQGNALHASDPIRVRRGPPRRFHDPRWCIAAPDDALQRMQRIEQHIGLQHKLHHTAFRETVASEVVALNLLEYDGMPWQFYLDMCRQCEDEARHSLMAADLLARRGGTFSDFALPYLGSYYEMFWEMNLIERLVALNLDIEAVGHHYLVEIAERLQKLGDANGAETFSTIAHDERRHARIGVVWLRHLFPQADARHEMIESCRQMFVLNLASADAATTGADIASTLFAWADGDPVLNYNEERGVQHEHEVTPLLIRTKYGRAAADANAIE